MGCDDLLGDNYTKKTFILESLLFCLESSGGAGCIAQPHRDKADTWCSVGTGLGSAGFCNQLLQTERFKNSMDEGWHGGTPLRSQHS